MYLISLCFHDIRFMHMIIIILEFTARVRIQDDPSSACHDIYRVGKRFRDLAQLNRGRREADLDEAISLYQVPYF